MVRTPVSGVIWLMRRLPFARQSLVVLGICTGIAAGPGCGSDTTETAKPDPSSATPSTDASSKPAASGTKAAPKKKTDSSSRRERQKELKEKREQDPKP